MNLYVSGIIIKSACFHFSAIVRGLKDVMTDFSSRSLTDPALQRP